MLCHRNICRIPELVESGKSGLLVTLASVNVLIDPIITLINDSNLLDALIKIASKKVFIDCDIEKNTHKLEEFVEKM